MEGKIEIMAMEGGHIEVHADLKHVSRTGKAMILSSVMSAIDIDPEDIVDLAELMARIVALNRTARIQRFGVHEDLIRFIDQKGGQT